MLGVNTYISDYTSMFDRESSLCTFGDARTHDASTCESLEHLTGALSFTYIDAENRQPILTGKVRS